MTIRLINKTAHRTEFGDWQTPADLARQICTLAAKRIKPNLVFEPNCGEGVFLRESMALFPKAKRFLGLDINAEYVRKAQFIRSEALEVVQGDFFSYDWTRHLDESSGAILVIGNPPWVTNAELMRIGGTNVPRKANINGLNGMDAITGKSNFDISEWMLIKETEALQGKDALLLMLCKTSTARKVIRYAWKNSLRFTDAEIRVINAQRHFGVAANACLMVIRFCPWSDTQNTPCGVYDSIDAATPSHILGLRNGRLVSNVDMIEKYRALIVENMPIICWRSGIKHDCSQIMELQIQQDGGFVNRLGEYVDIEDNLVFPMLKSSDLANGKTDSIRRAMLVPQRSVGSDTASIAFLYPRTWKYLQDHVDFFNKRKSSIYRNKPRFSVFGVGEYSFTHWKVAISGLYKTLKFRVIGPFHDKPVVLDDTCYFLPCRSEEEALLVKDLLESKVCSEILEAVIFWDSKRPITREVLNAVDLPAVARFLGRENTFTETFSRLFLTTQSTLF